MLIVVLFPATSFHPLFVDDAPVTVTFPLPAFVPASATDPMLNVPEIVPPLIVPPLIVAAEIAAPLNVPVFATVPVTLKTPAALCRIPLLVPPVHVEAPATVRVPVFVAPLMVVAALAVMAPLSVPLVMVVAVLPSPMLRVPPVCLMVPLVLVTPPTTVRLAEELFALIVPLFVPLVNVVALTTLSVPVFLTVVRSALLTVMGLVRMPLVMLVAVEPSPMLSVPAPLVMAAEVLLTQLLPVIVKAPPDDATVPLEPMEAAWVPALIVRVPPALTLSTTVLVSAAVPKVSALMVPWFVLTVVPPPELMVSVPVTLTVWLEPLPTNVSVLKEVETKDGSSTLLALRNPPARLLSNTTLSPGPGKPGVLSKLFGGVDWLQLLPGPAPVQ